MSAWKMIFHDKAKIFILYTLLLAKDWEGDENSHQSMPVIFVCGGSVSCGIVM